MSLQDTLLQVDALRAELAALRPLNAGELARLREQFAIENTYNSNAIEGNTLTLRKQVALVGQNSGLNHGQRPVQLRDAFAHFKGMGHAPSFAAHRGPGIASESSRTCARRPCRTRPRCRTRRTGQRQCRCCPARFLPGRGPAVASGCTRPAAVPWPARTAGRSARPSIPRGRPAPPWQCRFAILLNAVQYGLHGAPIILCVCQEKTALHM